MAVGVRSQDLRKVYHSSPPLGAAGGFIAREESTLCANLSLPGSPYAHVD
jgi:hypothetical protein